MAIDGGRLLSAEEVAHYLGVSKWTVLEMGQDGRIPRISVGRRTVRFDPADVEKYIRRNKEG